MYKPVKFIAHNISYTRDNYLLFENINCTFEQGNIIHIEGKNGSGKTTLLNIFAGLLKPLKGNILLQNTTGNIQGHTTYLSSTPATQESITLTRYLTYWTMLYNHSINISTTLISNTLAEMGLYEYQNLPIEHLSFGQKKRLFLAKVVLSNRLLWLLDEPTVGLDSYWTDFFYQLILQHVNTGGLVIMTTHTVHQIKSPIILSLNNN